MTGDWMADLDPALRARAFADAKDSAVAAQMDFAEAKEKYGPRVALAMFNARVDRWAREFTNPRLSRVLYVTGQAMDGATHSYPISVNGNVRGGTKGDRDRIVKGSLLWRYSQTYIKAGPNDTPRTISYRRFHHWLAVAEAEGVEIITRTRQPRQGPDDWHPQAWQPSIIHVNFWKVLVGNDLLPHNFSAPFDVDLETIAAWYARQDAENDTRDDTRDDTGHDTRDDTHSYVSRYVSDESRASFCTEKDGRPPSRGNRKTNDRAAPPPGPTPGQGANAPRPRKQDGWETRINTYMIRPSTGYYYHPGDTQARPKKEDVRVVLRPEEGMELNDREANPTQKDRMRFMKELLESRHEEKAEAAAARVRAKRDAMSADEVRSEPKERHA